MSDDEVFTMQKVSSDRAVPAKTSVSTWVCTDQQMFFVCAAFDLSLNIFVNFIHYLRYRPGTVICSVIMLVTVVGISGILVQSV